MVIVVEDFRKEKNVVYLKSVENEKEYAIDYINGIYLGVTNRRIKPSNEIRLAPYSQKNNSVIWELLSNMFYYRSRIDSFAIRFKCIEGYFSCLHKIDPKEWRFYEENPLDTLPKEYVRMIMNDKNKLFEEKTYTEYKQKKVFESLSLEIQEFSKTDLGICLFRDVIDGDYTKKDKEKQLIVKYLYEIYKNKRIWFDYSMSNATLFSKSRYIHNLLNNYKNYLQLRDTLIKNNKQEEEHFPLTPFDLLYKINLAKQKYYAMQINNNNAFNFQQNLGFDYGDFIIVQPRNFLDLDDEGNQQGNCAGYAYNESIIENKYAIVFMRDKKAVDTSLITVGMDIQKKEGFYQVKITQIQKTKGRKTEEEKDFLSNYATYIQEKRFEIEE